MRHPRTATALSTAVAALVSASLLVSAPVVAAPSEEKARVDATIDDLSEDLAGTSEELTTAYAALASAQAALPAAQQALEAAEAAEAEAERKDVELAGRLVAAQDSQTVAEQEVADSSEGIQDSEAAIGRLASEVYRSGYSSAEIQVALGSTSPDDFATRYVLADAVMRSRSSSLSRLQQTMARQGNAETRLAAVEVEVTDLRRQAAENLVAAEAARTEAVEQRAEVDRLVAAQAQAVATIEARKAEETARLAALEVEQTRLEVELARIAAAEKAAAEKAAAEAAAERAARERASRSAGGSGRSTSSSSGSSAAEESPQSGGTLARPVTGPVTSGYGYRIHPIYGTRRLHAGTDFGSPCGTPIRAAADGTVVSSGWAGGYGNRIVLNHGVLRGEGVSTTYNHMSGYAARSGAVSRGEVIGYIGTTGASTGCHLHFEVYVNGQTTNPMGWM